MSAASPAESRVGVRRGPVVVDDHPLTPLRDHPADALSRRERQRPQAVRQAVPDLRHQSAGRLVPEEQRSPARADQLHRTPVDQVRQRHQIQLPCDLGADGADGLDLRRPSDQRLVRLSAFSDVEPGPQQLCGPIGLPHEVCLVEEPAVGAVGALPAVLHGRRRGLRQGAGYPQRGRPVVRMQARGPEARGVREPPGGKAGEPLDVLADPQAVMFAGRAGAVQDHGHGTEHRCPLHLAVAQRRRGAHSRSDVLHELQRADDLAGGVPYRRRPQADLDHGAIAPLAAHVQPDTARTPQVRRCPPAKRLPRALGPIGGRLAQHVRFAPAEDALRGRVPHRHLRIAIDGNNRQRRCLDQRPKNAVRPPQSLSHVPRLRPL